MQEDLSRFSNVVDSITARTGTTETRFVVGGLFAGIAGFELGFREHGYETGMLCEADPAAQAVLAHQFPDAAIVSDIRQLGSLDGFDVITAGFPCQDLSQVGRTKGINGNESGLVNEVFRLLKLVNAKTKWLILENVPFMLRLHQGHAIRYVTDALDGLGWHWAYRTINTQAFGLPQRRLRVFIVASRDSDPRKYLLSDDAGAQIVKATTNTPRGFYWTEGHRGLGRAINAVPPLKGGSGLSIPSPPAVWFPETSHVVTPSIEAAERLQGFPSGWTEAARGEANGERRRWRLVGNAVSVPVAAWLGRKLRHPVAYDDSRDVEFSPMEKWPQAASRVNGRLTRSLASDWPVHIPALALESFLGRDVMPLSLRAASGFLGRLEHSSLRHDPLFVLGMRKYVAAVRKVTTSHEPALNEQVSRRMANTRAHSNAAELALRSALHKLNYRFRINYKAVPGLRRTADIAFPSLRVAVFVDGCFWHACPIHGTWPKHNAKWWREKIEANRARDADTNQRLKEQGWTVVRVWEHENAEVVARRLSHLLSSRKARRNAKRSKA